MRVDDRWLEQAFDTYRGMKEMGNVSAFITDDRNYLICFPMDFWNRGWGKAKDGQRNIVDTFEWKGTSYDRKDWAFYFKRGSLDPIPFRKPSVEGVKQFFSAPSQGLSINGEPALLYMTKTSMVLVTLTTNERRTFVVPRDPNTEFMEGPGVQPDRVQHLAGSYTVAFFAAHYMGTAAALYLWNYQTGANSLQSFDTTQLFRPHFFGLNGPNKPLPIREAVNKSD